MGLSHRGCVARNGVGAAGLELGEVPVGALIKVGVGGFVLAEGGHELAIQLVVGEGLHGRLGGRSGEGGDTKVAGGGFDADNTAETPFGHGHLFDAQELGVGGRTEIVEQRDEQALELILIFVEEDGRFGGEAVGEGVQANAVLPHARDRPLRLAAIQPGGGLLFFGPDFNAWILAGEDLGLGSGIWVKMFSCNQLAESKRCEPRFRAKGPAQEGMKKEERRRKLEGATGRVRV